MNLTITNKIKHGMRVLTIQYNPSFDKIYKLFVNGQDLFSTIYFKGSTNYAPFIYIYLSIRPITHRHQDCSASVHGNHVET